MGYGLDGLNEVCEALEFRLAQKLGSGIKCFMPSSKAEREEKDAALGRVSFLDGQGELRLMEITTRWSTAELYLHGAHVTRFNKKDGARLLFSSQCSRFA